MKTLSLETVTLFGFGISVPVFAAVIILCIIFMMFGMMTPFTSTMLNTMGGASGTVAILSLISYYVQYTK